MHIPIAEFLPWSSARFQTQEARDRFLSVVAAKQSSEVEVTRMPDESRSALVRWRPGQFLRLNDIAYAHGGRIVVSGGRR